MALSRRGMLAFSGASAGAVGLGVGGFFAGRATSGPTVAGAEELVHAYHGEHQAGIITPAQEQLHFAAFDMMPGQTRDDLVELLKDWTYAASRMALGAPVGAGGAFDGNPLAPPVDTGEAADHGPNGLTLTIGFGRSLFVDAEGNDRFGIADQLPEQFTKLPKMVNDFIKPAISDGDLCVQACANDPQVAVHAIRNLTRIAFGRANLRWAQLGFGRASSTSKEQQTPRNLFGQKDGTNNIKAEETDKLAEHVWISEGPEWAHGGSYLIARKISMTIEVWDGLQLEEQDRVLGRAKGSGAPLSGGDEFTAPDFGRTGSNGKPLIDPRSHVARTHPDNNGGIQMLRRAYNYVDGSDEQGRLAAGLFFIAYVKEPARFAKVHRNMARDDMFIEYLKTLGSGVYLVPPGCEEGGYIGERLFSQ
ncbi:deferrochelatase/peroxidase EfeB [Arachnia propionica]|uniref:Deferrochelatase n=1 Tax=Arachnia propionica TaxID=1750 RepID=A0A3P1TE80_9ACTN|nr:iron uptake transporter deferrochelatase/peroxidase subunit [Arachnia propionica]RRD07206.1 deferrochelatase/peroxidase EfeB [Arachnia propionica]